VNDMRIICNKCKEEYFDLEKRNCDCGGVIAPTKGKQGENYWTESKLIDGFRRFLSEYGHFPTATEVDKCNYLPAARSIQRTFGGLIKLREKYNLGAPNFQKGEHRSNIAYKLNKDSRESENDYFDYLKSVFGEIFVHREKPINKNSKTRYDFFVYAKSGNFAVDVFNPNDIKNLAGCVNIKIAKLDPLDSIDSELKQYLVNLNAKISQSSIDKIISNKKNLLPSNIIVINSDKFKSFIENNAIPYCLAD